MAERRHVGAACLARQTGFTSRWFTGLAARGKIPGAYQPGGRGGAWRFDEDFCWLIAGRHTTHQTGQQARRDRLRGPFISRFHNLILS